ncbi:MAG TPA: orotidine-5'-phosphate decarboxylase [Tepidisphaeraceae bacterium]|jgi:orotidine-5'-phosphate decarboxylase|nr:orotidine-5'-phosphate decarboxylase [Tepidisphaeraceae bacterium]
MSDLFADRLLSAIARKGSPICVGIDPIYEMLPDAVLTSPRDADDAEASIDAIFKFTTAVLKIVAPHVPIVKFQSAYFEKYLWEGVEAYYSLVQEAKELGLLVIGDVKRGDIGSTSAAYAAAHLADPQFDEMDDVVTPDAITVNPMLGMDTLEPFIKAAKDYDKGLFVLVRTSNPGSAELQDVKLADGRTWSEALADKLAPLAAQPGLVGDSGYSSLGAVVGATQTSQIESLRGRLPKSIFLLPGYGTQGATADMTKAAFTNGQGAIVSASRSILYAHRDAKIASQCGGDWQACVAKAVEDMKADLAGVIR